MGINFPNSPTIGQLWPQPATPGVPVYRWDGQAWVAGSADSLAAVVLRSYLAGLTLSTAGSSAAFSVAPGVAVDSGNVDTLTLASAISKTTSTWAVGTGLGALDTGTIAASSWYHVFLIKRTDTRVVDVLLSLSATAPTLPANYTLFRRIGSMKTNASLQWTAFLQNGDDFLWDVPIGDVTGDNLIQASKLYPLSIPLGIIVNAKFNSLQVCSIANTHVVFSSPGITVQAANSPAGNENMSVAGGATANVSSGQFAIRSNNLSQIRAVSTATSGMLIYIVTTGWIDRRGRDD